ncbi:MAG TPA: hypothetical protein VGO25_13355 [Rhodanobacteraceae bacterium]|jgi:hypothetical protein|nr:hypothetical protein [Rhodanobacteraceae bacterium]
MAFGLFSVFAAIAALVVLAFGAALLPAFLVIGAIVLALSLFAAVAGIVFRVIGWLLLIVLALPLMLATFGLALAFGIAILHATLPLLLVVGIVWLIVHHHRGAQAAPPAR